MALAWTTTELLAAIRQEGRIADDDTDATNANLLLEANRQMDITFVPLVRKARSEWYVTHKDYAIVAGQQEYRIPRRSTVSSVRTVVWVDTSGIERELMPIPLTDRHLYAPQQGVPYCYTMRDDGLLLLPTPSAAYGTLRVVYEQSPSALVPTTAALQTTAVGALASGAQALTAAGTPSPAFGTTLDIVSADPPFSVYMQAASFIKVSTVYTMTLGASDRALPTDGGGAWLCTPYETVFPQIPPELHPVLAIATAARWLRAIDPATSQLLAQDAASALTQLGDLMQPRQQGRQMKLKSTQSMMRRHGRRRGSFGDWR